MGEVSSEPSKPKGLIGYLVAGVAGLALLVTNMETIYDGYCKHIGTFCHASEATPPIEWAESNQVDVTSGGGKKDACDARQTSVCVRPKGANRKLLPGTIYFDGAHSAGGFIDNKPVNADPIGTSNIGWIVDQKRNGSEEVCATVYARTSACETKVYISGRLKVQQISKSTIP